MDRITISRNTRKAGVVYTALNRVNGKRYIGVTSYPLARRRSEHERLALLNKGASTIFYAAIRKHGQDAFEWSILVACATYAEALQEEIRLISEMAPAYNITGGGQGRLGWSPSAEERQRISERLRGRGVSPETRAKISAKVRGFRHSDDARQRIGAARVGYETPGETRLKMSIAAKTSPAAIAARTKVQHAKRKRIRVLPSGLIFESHRALAAHLGVTASAITNSIKRGRPLLGLHTLEATR